MPKQAKEELKYKEFVRFKLLQEFARDDFYSTYITEKTKSIVVQQ